MNLVPYPRQHFLLSSMSPLAAPKDMGKLVAGPKAMDQVLTQWEAQCVVSARAMATGGWQLLYPQVQGLVYQR